jgi:tRNA(fMet)-specific endonuclease VapC
LAFLIDTNIAIHIRDGHETVVNNFNLNAGSVMMSALTMAELQRGLFKYPANTAIRQSRLKTMLEYIPVLPFDTAAAEAYGEIISLCGWVKGRDFDRMIAAHAISARAVLVTNNVKDFQDIPRLSIENWASL